jgi:hypothetical protein
MGPESPVHYQPASVSQAKIVPFKASKKSYKEAMANGACKGGMIPVDKNGMAFCLGYHIRVECWMKYKWQESKKNQKQVEPLSPKPLRVEYLSSLVNYMDVHHLIAQMAGSPWTSLALSTAC